ncbi:MAG: M36 family metallopeptidase, partial [Pyrinomonadaceae bacterium]
MNLQSFLRTDRSVIAILFLLALITGVASLPFAFRAKAALPPTEAGLPNYDIRIDKAAKPMLDSYRQIAGRSETSLVEFRDSFSRAENDLRRDVPTLTTVFNDDLKVPEVIATNVKQGKAFLSRPSSQKRSDVLKAFLRDNSELVGARASQIDELKVAADYTNPDGNLSFVELNQEINGVPVFRGEVKAGFTQAGEIIRVINNLAPGIDAASVSSDFGDSTFAVTAAARHINVAVDNLSKSQNSTELRSSFGKGDSATTAEKMYFPTEPGVVVPAWRVLIWQPANAYYVVVDGQGTLLWRKNLTDHQTQPATYNVYANPSAMLNIAHSPFPFSPGPTSPAGQHGTAISRTNVTRIGNEAPYTFNQLGWIPDGSFITDGNNVQAGLDRDGTDGVDPNSEAFSGTRLFSYTYQPYNPSTASGDIPIPTPQTYPGSAFQQGIVTQLFYTTNWFHDETYRLGFTEAARNFQNTNFTGQGLADDRVRGEGQDSIGFNNANFSTAADGVRGRMQMFFFSGPNPDIDGSLDNDVVIHELTHGLSSRLHGNSLGLFNDMSRGMGEGWSDFFGMAMLSTPNDPIDSLATNGAYVTHLFQGEVNNAYYGIRRFPTAIKSSLGGPNNRPHNPLTFADIDATQLNISDGAFAPRFDNTSDQVHNAGEIWCSALWEVRAKMIQRLGWEVGNRRILQLVTDGMKLAPLSPTPVTERDAIVAAAYATGNAADVADIWAGFAIRGLGANASIQNVGGTSTGGTGTARVTEAFNAPNLLQAPAITVSDAIGDNDGYPEPGETVMLNIPLTNSTGVTATNVQLVVVGSCGPIPCFVPVYGTMEGASTRTSGVAYTIPPGAPCGGTIQVSFNVTSSLGPVSFTRSIFIGKPTTTITTENFDGVTAPVLPSLWTATPTSGGTNFVTSTLAPDSAPNAVYALNPTTVGGGSDLAPPPVAVTSATSALTFRHRFNTELSWDGGVLDISIAGGEWLDFKAAGGSFLQNGYNGINGAGRNNPVGSRESWTGRSPPPTADYITTIAQFPAAANGKIVQLRFRFGSDDNTAGTLPNPGWFIDNVSLSGAGFVTSFACSGGVATR